MKLKPTHYFQKDISNCGLTGFISKSGTLVEGSVIIQSITLMHDRGNGLGGGFAAYGIYPDYKEFFAFHLMYENGLALQLTEEYLEQNFFIEQEEDIPTRRISAIANPPVFKRYFVKPLETAEYRESIEFKNMTDEDVIVHHVMRINNEIEGAFVVSSGKNMGAFKGVGYPEEIAEFFRLEEYSGYIWTAHNRFPTNTPGWWGGAHPFTLLDWSIVHNGEISSYGINKRYLEMYGYLCTMLTDTEVVAYMLDLLIRKHGLTPELASLALAVPFLGRHRRAPRERPPGVDRHSPGLRQRPAERPLRHPVRQQRRADRPERPGQAPPPGLRGKGRLCLHGLRRSGHPRNLPRPGPGLVAARR